MAESMKLGMVGLDTSHCPRFAELLNDDDNRNRVSGGKITVAYPGGSRLFSKSVERVEGFTKQMREEFGVQIARSIEEAAEGVDGVFLESVDGRQHLEQFEKLAPFGKPVFIDKPLATSAEDAKKIMELSEKYNSPVFSCSAIRYAAGISELGAGSRTAGCTAFGPAAILPDYPGYFWYGVHSAEVLFSKMGTGCREIAVTVGSEADVITGKWDDGRIGNVYGYRMEGVSKFGCVVFGDRGVEMGTAKGDPPYYALMLPDIIKFFRTGKSPVPAGQMLEITAFLDAAGKSRESGALVSLEV